MHGLRLPLKLSISNFWDFPFEDFLVMGFAKWSEKLNLKRCFNQIFERTYLHDGLLV